MRAIQLFRQEFAPNLSPAGIVANRVRTGSSEHAFRLAEMQSMFGDLLLTPAHPGTGQLAADPGCGPLRPPLARRLRQDPRPALFDTLLGNLMSAGNGQPQPQPPLRRSRTAHRATAGRKNEGRLPDGEAAFAVRRWFPRAGSAGQPILRAARRLLSSSSGKDCSLACSLGSDARLPSTSRHTRPTAMPKTPCPPWTRSMTSSAEVHS